MEESGKEEGGLADLQMRIGKLEGKIEHLATKEDLQSLKVWILTGIVTGLGLTATIVLGILRIFAIAGD